MLVLGGWVQGRAVLWVCRVVFVALGRRKGKEAESSRWACWGQPVRALLGLWGLRQPDLRDRTGRPGPALLGSPPPPACSHCAAPGTMPFLFARTLRLRRSRCNVSGRAALRGSPVGPARLSGRWLLPAGVRAAPGRSCHGRPAGRARCVGAVPAPPAPAEPIRCRARVGGGAPGRPCPGGCGCGCGLSPTPAGPSAQGWTTFWGRALRWGFRVVSVKPHHYFRRGSSYRHFVGEQNA